MKYKKMFFFIVLPCFDLNLTMSSMSLNISSLLPVASIDIRNFYFPFSIGIFEVRKGEEERDVLPNEEICN